MIPIKSIHDWNVTAPWSEPFQVEQDLIISRALCELFNSPALKGKLAFRGGTAINKLVFAKALRYSEDIDLVQIHAEPIGATVDAMRQALSWIGKCSREHAQHSLHLFYKFSPENDPNKVLKLKVEVNTREHTHFFPHKSYPFTVTNDWYSGSTVITSFEPEELFATKLKALLQRRKNRDLFDMYHGLDLLGLDLDKLLSCFEHYSALEGVSISRAMAEERMLEKLKGNLNQDIDQYLPLGTKFNNVEAVHAFERVWAELIPLLKGESWKLTDKVIEDLKQSKYPGLKLESTLQPPRP